MFKLFSNCKYPLTLTLLLAAMAAGSLAGRAWGDDNAAYPKPSEFPISWELTFKHSEPKRIEVTLPGQSTPQAFWYMTYSVVNPGDQSAAADPDREKERVFYPAFTVRTEDGKLIEANDGIHPEVFDAIKALERIKYLQEPTLFGGRILLGEDQEQDSVVIWPQTTARVGTFTVFATGMWGETAVAKDSQGNVSKDANGDDIYLHKTLSMTYHVDGDETHFTPVRKVKEEYVMR